MTKTKAVAEENLWPNFSMALRGAVALPELFQTD